MTSARCPGLGRSILLLSMVAAATTEAASLPAGFTETLIAGGISSPTAMELAPDRRIFVCEQGGRLVVIKNGVLLSQSFLNLTGVVDATGERGLLGVAFHPSFATNNFVYVYYTLATAPRRNRVSRFTASGDVAVPGSEVVILELDTLSSATNHNGGAIHFGPDGKLYVAVGDNANGANAKSLSSRHGKMLRINPDGSIPSDNPFYSSLSGVYRAIWAYGLRNPFTFAFQPGTERMFINDVGQATWEEINDGIAGSYYGWPDSEGPTTLAGHRNPLFAYAHGSTATTGCAIVGAVFYNPSVASFPSAYVGRYFFADYCRGWIRTYDRATSSVSAFATGITRPVDLKVAADGRLYYLAMGSGSTTGGMYRVSYTASQAPSISTHPASQTAPVGGPVSFSVSASGTAPLGYQWQQNGSNIAGATAPSYTIAAVSAGDNGASFRAVVSNAFGSATSNAAVLTITSNTAPTGTISAPATGTLYRGGDTISYAGSGTDAQDGTLPAGAFTWEIVFHHDTHTHPFMGPTSGSKSGSFTVPTTGHTESNVWYRIHLTVRDSGGLTHRSFVDVRPRTVTLQLTTVPPGLQIALDDQPRATPLSEISVAGVERRLGAISPQTLSGSTYVFSAWSDGGATTHTIWTPATATTYTATYVTAPGAGGLVAAYGFDESAGTSVSDRSGRGNTGTLSGATWAAGRTGSAVAFDGVDDWITVPDAPALDLTTGMTLEAWVYPTRVSGWQTLITKERAGPSVYGLFASTGPDIRASAKIMLPSGNQRVYGASALPVNTWTHLAATYDGAALRLYVNGSPVGSRALSGAIATSGAPLRLGGNAVYGEFFRGRVDDVRIYNRALSAAEIVNDMNVPVTSGSSPPTTNGTLIPLGYASRAGLLADGWDFLARTAAGATRNTERTAGRVVSYDQAVHRGVIRIPADVGTPWRADNNTRNTLFRNLPPDWRSVRLKIKAFAPTADYQSACLMVYQNDDHYVIVCRASSRGQVVEWWHETNGSPTVLGRVASTITGGMLVRLDREPATQRITAFLSVNDGASWTSVPGSVVKSLSSPRLAIFVGGNTSTTSFPPADLASATVMRP
jgi:glucose/arabinose dehydrogenase